MFSWLKKDWVFIAAALLLAAWLRLDLLIANNWVIDSDEAIVGLMAKHITEGREIPTFYYGQHYMGSLEPVITALVFKCFGVSEVGLKLVPLFFSLAILPLIYLLGFTLGGLAVGRLAALFWAAPPSALIIWSSMARGGFIELVFLGTLGLVLLTRWLRSPSIFGTILIGLVLGLGWWVNNQILYFMLPTGLAMLGRTLWGEEFSLARRLGHVVRHALAGVSAWLIGGLPFWLYNLRNDFVSFEIFKSAPSGKMATYLADMVSIALPILLGGKRFWHTEDFFYGSSAIAAILYGVLALCVLYWRRRPLLRLLRLRFGPDSLPEVLIIFIVGIGLIFAGSKFGDLAKAPRYLLPLYPAIFLLGAWGAVELYRRTRGLASALVVGIFCLNLSSAFLGGRAIPGEPVVHDGQRVSKDHTELIKWLLTNGITHVRTNYWLGYRLAFETREQVTFQVFTPPCQARMPEYENVSPEKNGQYVPIILVPRQAEMARNALPQMGYSFKEVSLSGYNVFYDVKPFFGFTESSLVKLPSTDLTASSSIKPDIAKLAIDGDIESRWGTGTAQKPGMSFNLAIGQPKLIAEIAYDLGPYVTDFARALRVELVTESGESSLLFDPVHYPGIRYFSACEKVRFFIEPRPVKQIIFTQTGSDPVFDWSIAELELYSTDRL